MRSRKRWRDLSGGQRAVVLTMASAEIALTATAAVDLARRPQELIRGPRPLWWLGIFVQPIGPIAYLAVGRRRVP